MKINKSIGRELYRLFGFNGSDSIVSHGEKHRMSALRELERHGLVKLNPYGSSGGVSIANRRARGLSNYSLAPVVEAGNDLANDLQLYFDALSGKNTELEPAWRLEQVAKSLKIYQTEQAACPIKNGKTGSNLAGAAK